MFATQLHKPQELQADPAQQISACAKRAGLTGQLIVGGSSAYGPGHEQKRDCDTCFIFGPRAELEDFLRKSSPSDIERCFGFDAGSAGCFTSAEIDFFCKQQIEVLRISGSIAGEKTTVKLIAAEDFAAVPEIQTKRVLSKGKNKQEYTGRSVDGDIMRILLVNEVLPVEPGQSPAFVIYDQNYFCKDGKLVAGLFTDFVVTGRICSGSPEEQQRHRALFAAVYGADADPAKVCVRGSKFSDEFAGSLGQELHTAAKLHGSDFASMNESVDPGQPLRNASEPADAIVVTARQACADPGRYREQLSFVEERLTPPALQSKAALISSTELFDLSSAYFSQRVKVLEKREKLGGGAELADSATSFVLLKPDALQSGRTELLRSLLGWAGLQLVEESTIKLPPEALLKLWPRSIELGVYSEICAEFAGQTARLLRVEGDAAIDKTLALKRAFRELYGQGKPGAFLHCPDDPSERERELELIFEHQAGDQP